MGQVQLFLGQLTTANLGSTSIDSTTQGDANSMPFALSLVIDITALTGTSIAVQPLLIDPVSGKKLLYGAAFTALVAPSTKAYLIGSTGLGAAAGDVAGAPDFPGARPWAGPPLPGAGARHTATGAVLPAAPVHLGGKGTD